MAIQNDQYTYVSNFNAQDQADGVQLLTNEKGHMYPLSHIFSGEALGDSFKVTQTSPASSMVQVNNGYLQVPTSNNFSYHAWMEAPENNLTKITGLTGGDNNRIVSIVAYIKREKQYDETVTNNEALLVITKVNGNQASSPVPPDDNKIKNEIGDNPYVVLANVYVAAGATSITDSNITDTRESLRLADDMRLGNNTYSSGIRAYGQSGDSNPIKIAVIQSGATIPTPEDDFDLLVFELVS